MGAKYTNVTNLSLSMAVFLATDHYDHSDDPKELSATALIKPLKKVIMGSRVDPDDNPADISGMLKAQCGTAVHTAVEVAWVNNYAQAMADLGYPKRVIDMVRINPTDEEMAEYKKTGTEILPVYLEQRTVKEIGGIKISGKYDLIVDGVLEDVKNTSTYTYIKKTNDRDYQLQGSIYRWLNPDKITADHMLIQYVFTDWSAAGARMNKNYPPAAQMAYKVPLMSVAETESYILDKLAQLKKYWEAPESDIPPCTREDLWQDPTVWKYYKNPKSTARSTKNFDNMIDAHKRCNDDGNVGIVVEVPGKAKACAYCQGFAACIQKEAYFGKTI